MQFTQSQKGPRLAHGHKPRDGQSPTYITWQSMRQRCADPERYGRLGITVHPSWNDFAQFLKDMGERPEGMTIDRIDSAGNYEPGNCRWADASTQASNRSDRVLYEAEGKSQILSRWAEEKHIALSCLLKRLRLGWPAERAITTPSRKRSAA